MSDNKSLIWFERAGAGYIQQGAFKLERQTTFGKHGVQGLENVIPATSPLANVNIRESELESAFLVEWVALFKTFNKIGGGTFSYTTNYDQNEGPWNPGAYGTGLKFDTEKIVVPRLLAGTLAYLHTSNRGEKSVTPVFITSTSLLNQVFPSVLS